MNAEDFSTSSVLNIVFEQLQPIKKYSLTNEWLMLLIQQFHCACLGDLIKEACKNEAEDLILQVRYTLH